MQGYAAGNLAGALILLEYVEEVNFRIVNTSIIYTAADVEKNTPAVFCIYTFTIL